jgi:hypothetical protein
MNLKNTILITVTILLLGVSGYFVFITSSPVPVSKDKILSDLGTSWVVTQSKFSSRAGESGTYNQPDRVQFISEDTLLVHYDDGLVDHISVVRYENGAFTELKKFGAASTMSIGAWQMLVKDYGDQDFSAISYATSILRNGKMVNFQTLTRVSENVFVR